MPAGGTLTIATSVPDDELVRVTVADTGHGISAEHLPRIFDPFFTTKSDWPGIGMGLSVVHKTIEDHGGSIEVESDVDKGTTFVLTFPAHAGDGGDPLAMIAARKQTPLAPLRRPGLAGAGRRRRRCSARPGCRACCSSGRCRCRAAAPVSTAATAPFGGAPISEIGGGAAEIANLFRLVTAQGQVEAYRDGQWIPIPRGDLLRSPDVVRTSAGRARRAEPGPVDGDRAQGERRDPPRPTVEERGQRRPAARQGVRARAARRRSPDHDRQRDAHVERRADALRREGRRDTGACRSPPPRARCGSCRRAKRSWCARARRASAERGGVPERSRAHPRGDPAAASSGPRASGTPRRAPISGNGQPELAR